MERSGCFVKSTDLLVETGDQHLICSAAFPAPLLLLLLLQRLPYSAGTVNSAAAEIYFCISAYGYSPVINIHFRLIA